MPKRKRLQSDRVGHNGGANPDHAVELQRQLAEAKIVHGRKLLNRALKTAKGFERQKLGRRQKVAKEKNDAAESARLDAEVGALKALDLPVTAELHLYKTLLKSKPVSTAPGLPTFVQPRVEALQEPPSTARNNVLARLYASNPVKTTMTEVFDTVCEALGIPQEGKGKGKNKRAKIEQEKNTQTETPKRAANLDEVEGDDLAEQADGNGESGPEWEGFESEQSPAHRQSAADEDEDQDQDDLSRYDARLASSSDEDSGEDELSRQTMLKGMKRRISRDMSISPSPEESSNPSRDLSISPSLEDESPPPRNTSKPSKQKATPSAPNSTTFLPSLMMGGYWSGSESGDDDDNDDDVAGIKPRKNRMGQQARRALWEKKYGKRANHIKNTERDRDWDPRRGAREEGGPGRGRGAGRGRGYGRGGHGDMGHGRGGHQNGGFEGGFDGRATKPPPKKDDQGSLHPSWEAAKKAKEQKAAISFQGKKVVFD
ncbi:MAG: hypothetical protein M1819_003367 [Sarea resinae]|nr:MAG: hypothetical protein M1819_003367 [Sarea resinae]